MGNSHSRLLTHLVGDISRLCGGSFNCMCVGYMVTSGPGSSNPLLSELCLSSITHTLTPTVQYNTSRKLSHDEEVSYTGVAVYGKYQ